jgi:competence/damage-inducible protein cinA
MLKSRGPPVYFAERVIEVRGVPEADVSPVIREVMRLDPRVYVKSHPKGLEVDAPLLQIHIYASAESREDAEALVETATGKLESILREKFGGKAHIRRL